MLQQRKTKIICTIGPSSDSLDKLKELIAAGMNIARLNFSHGSHAVHRQTIANIREASRQMSLPIPIIGDLCGPKIRIGKLEQEIPVFSGEYILLTSAGNLTTVTDEKILPVKFSNLYRDINIEERILIDDGLIELQAVEKSETGIRCRVLQGGRVKSQKGVNFPDSTLTLPSLTDKDLEDIDFAVENGIEYLALSFLRSSKDVMDLIEILKSKNHRLPIIAKIEKPQAIADIDNIIDCSDAIMIARGDLGVEMSAYEVPILQKQIIRKCLLYNRPVITATQMLESMISNARCTRAEASDVANAVFDGTDAVMLSGETSVGKHPVNTVRTMHSILSRAENTEYLNINLFDGLPLIEKSQLAIDLSKAACRIAQDSGASFIVAMTKTGRTAHFLSKYRIKTPIIAFTPNRQTLPMLQLTWGVQGVLIDSFGPTDEILNQAKAYLLQQKIVEKEKLIVFVTGTPMLETNEINMIKIDKV